MLSVKRHFLLRRISKYLRKNLVVDPALSSASSARFPRDYLDIMRLNDDSCDDEFYADELCDDEFCDEVPSSTQFSDESPFCGCSVLFMRSLLCYFNSMRFGLPGQQPDKIPVLNPAYFKSGIFRLYALQFEGIIFLQSRAVTAAACQGFFEKKAWYFFRGISCF